MGDLGALETLFKRIYPRAFGTALQGLGSSQQAEDIAMEVVERCLVDRLPGFVPASGPPTPLQSYVVRGTFNAVKNERRTKRRHPLLPLDETVIDTPSVEPETVVIAREERTMLYQAIQQLNPPEQQLIYLKYVLGLRNRQVGEEVGMSENVVKVIIHRLNKKLRRILEEMGYEY